MKKIFCMLLAMCLVAICFCGCDNSSDKLTNNNIEETEEATEVCEHSFSEATCTEVSKCTICGEISGTPLGHSYSNATCSSPQKCTRCGQTNGNALGHSYSNATCTAPKKCTRCGVTTGSALGHSNNGNGACSRCGTSMSIDMKTKISTPSKADCKFHRDSAGGMKLMWTATNNSGKTINYYTVELSFQDKFGEKVQDQITGKSSKSVRIVGPVAPCEELLIFSIVGYSNICSEIVLGNIKLEYSDGTSDYGWYGFIAENLY